MIRRSQNPPNEAEAPADAAHSHLSRVNRAVYHMPSDQPALHQRPLSKDADGGVKPVRGETLDGVRHEPIFSGSHVLTSSRPLLA